MIQEYNWGKPVYKIGQEGQWKQLKDAFLIVIIYVYYNIMINSIESKYSQSYNTHSNHRKVYISH